MNRIFQVSPWLTNDELKGLEQAINDKWITEGPFTKLFLEKIKELTHSEYVLPVPNGTLGLFLSLLAFDAKPGDEIIIPSFTFFGSAASAHFAGFKPVFCDVNPKTYMLTIDDIEKKITTKTRGVMPVNIYGKSMCIDPIINFCRDKGLFIIEDAAQALGVFSEGKHLGTLGDVGVISFFGDKTVTTGEGGVLLVKETQLYERLKLLRNQGRPNSGQFIHPSFGMNFRITDMQAAIGLSQLKRLNEIINFKRRLFKLYNDKIEETKVINKPYIDQNFQDVPFRYYIQSNKKDNLIQFLEDSGIQARSFFYPMHLQPSITNHYGKQNDCPTSENLFNTGVCLPLHHDLRDKDVIYISETINSFSKKYI